MLSDCIQFWGENSSSNITGYTGILDVSLSGSVNHVNGREARLIWQKNGKAGLSSAAKLRSLATPSRHVGTVKLLNVSKIPFRPYYAWAISSLIAVRCDVVGGQVHLFAITKTLAIYESDATAGQED